MSADWDVNSYKTEFETHEHWELKKRFMLAHKDKFPEDELVCLAQVFTNIEFLGCRYPEQTMKRVAYLAKGLVEDFREKKKDCLKRTFVAASDAASAKVKGLIASQEVKSAPDPGQSKGKRKKKSDQTKSNNSEGKLSKKEIKRRNKQLRLEAQKTDIWSGCMNEWLLGQRSILNNFVVLYFEKKENPLTILTKSTSANNCQMRWCYENSSTCDKKVSKLYFNSELIAAAEGNSLKDCRRKTAKAALARLKENCFGIRLNRQYRGLGVYNRDFEIRYETGISNVLGIDNIGAKLMLLMGWKGGGLGRQEQGIKEPITPNRLARRQGLGSTATAMCDLRTFKRRAESFIKAWMQSDSRDDLLFSPEFTSDERRELHLIAHANCLHSKSQGKKNNRRILISRKQHPLEIVADLIKAGGATNKFELVYPNKFLQNTSTRGRP